MKKPKIGKSVYDPEEAYTEAQRRIKLCLERRRKKLDLSYLWIDRIPPEIAGLKHITSLKINSGRLTEIPGFIGELVSLKNADLRIGSTRYDNNDIHFHKSFGNLKNMRSLSIEGNLAILPEWIGNFDSLNSLFIESNSLKIISPEIGKLQKLHTLTIRSNSLTSLPLEIGNLKSLHSLVITCHEITELPAELAECPLVSLEVHCEKLIFLPESFRNLKRLQRFDSQRIGINKLPDLICDWESLEHFNAKWTGISTIPKRIGVLKNLKHLSIDGSFKQIPDSLGNCPLEELSLCGQFTNLPQTFGNLSMLKNLSLISGKLKSLPDSFENLHSLEKLYINTDEDLILPESFGKLSSLQNLSLHTENMKALPGSLGRCKSLKSIAIKSMALTQLPASFTKLENLKTVDLEAFNLQKLPASFGKLTALETIDIVSGMITKIPESLCSLKNLNYLYLDAYRIKKLPKSFQALAYAVGRKDINLGIPLEQEKPELLFSPRKENPEAVKKLNDLMHMGHSSRYLLLKSYSLKEVEALMFAMPWHSSKNSEAVTDTFDALKSRRWSILYHNFKPTKKNILRVVEVSDQFLKAWEDGFKKAKQMLDAIYEIESDKASFVDKYEAKIKLYPEILYKNSKTGEWEDRDDIFQVMYDYCNMDMLFDRSFRYDPATKDESDFWSDIHVDRKMNWNIEPPMPYFFREYYLCYAIHELWDHEEFAFQDISMINNITVDVEIEYSNRERRF